MTRIRWHHGLLVVCAFALVNVGCRTPRSGGAGEVGINPESLDDAALSERFEMGERVTDVTLRNVLFVYDSFQIRDNEIPKLEEAADYMRRNARIRLVAEGHCDERGSREYNMSLGEHRALSVRTYLIGLGVEGNRIQTRSYGEEKPLDPGHGESAWEQNRRAEFALYR